MAGYSRQSAASIVPTAVVRATPLNDEFNTLRDAFVVATGHKHDGTATEGAYIPLISDTNARNKVVVDSVNNRLGVFVNVSSSAVEQVRFVDGAFIPVTDNDVDLGSSTFEFKDLYIDGTANIDSLSADAVTILSGTINDTSVGATTPSTGAFTTLSATGQFTSTVSTGTAPFIVASTTKVNNLNVDQLDGGDWATPGAIGSSVANSGAFTTLSASSTATLSGLTASTALALNASNQIVSVTNTGSGNNVLATSPVLTTPNLGTPSAVTLTNATGLPLTTGVTGTLPVANGGTGITSFGTGVATALGQNVSGSGSIALTNSPTFTTPNLGTPSAVTLTNATGLPLTTGVTGTLPVANGGTGVTTSTGTGSVVLSNSPALTTPNLGTPSAATLTNATGLPISTGVSGLGTGVSSALATNTGSSGAFVVNGGALGTPSSGTLTNATGLPLSTGVTGTLPISNGGTGVTAAASNGQLLIGNGTGFTLATLTAGSNVTITNSSGGIIIGATGGGGGGGSNAFSWFIA